MHETSPGAAFERAAEKSRTYGFLSLSAEDHKAMGSTPDERLLANPGKAFFEILSPEEIVDALNTLYNNASDPQLFQSGLAAQSHEELGKSIKFLATQNILPEKYIPFLNEIQQT